MADAAKNQAIDFAVTCLPDLGGAGILPSLRKVSADLFLDFPRLTNDTDKKEFIRGILGQVPTTGLCVGPVPLAHMNCFVCERHCVWLRCCWWWCGVHLLVSTDALPPHLPLPL